MTVDKKQGDSINIRNVKIQGKKHQLRHSKSVYINKKFKMRIK